MIAKTMVVALVALMSALVAFLTYGVLDSTGTADEPAFSIGGAIVGFVVAFGLLSSLLKWLQRADNDRIIGDAHQEIERLRAKNDELSSQLIRGLSLPDGYTAEVLEHHKLVMARPESFVSRGGVILDLTASNMENGDDDEHLVDAVPARLYVNYQPAPHEDAQTFYDEYADRASLNPRFELMGVERMFVGVEERPRPALKVMTRSVAAVSITRHQFSGEYKLSSVLLKRDQWPASPDELDSAEIKVSGDSLDDPGFEEQITVAMRTAMVVCLHPQLKRVFFFVFEDDEVDFTHSVQALHRCIRSVRFLT